MLQLREKSTFARTTFGGRMPAAQLRRAAMKTGTHAFVAAGLLFLPPTAWSQGSDCNAPARDLVVNIFRSHWSDNSKLLFLSSLTQMDEKTAKEALDHSGRVSGGPINIGPGTWNKEKQEKLRSELQKIVNIEQLRRSAASISVSSGDPN